MIKAITSCLLILGHLIDNIGFDTAVTSLSVSPKADFLATSHVGDLGIYLWSNKGKKN